ncbi:MAG: D-alanine--D-alanine ligase A, partial [Proteobacteria bacterium]|nr:D-alanine--D-alanine ligase A [Pseudomonadota bacterium]
MTKTVLLLCGGKSEEHEISLISAKCLLDAFDRKLYTPIVVGIS